MFGLAEYGPKLALSWLKFHLFLETIHGRQLGTYLWSLFGFTHVLFVESVLNENVEGPRAVALLPLQ